MYKRYKVLQLCAVGFTAQKLLLPLIDKMGGIYDVTTVCSRDDYSDSLRDRGYSVQNIQIDRKIRPLANLKSLLNLYRYIKSEKFDVVHVHTPVAGILGRIAAKLARVPVVIYTAHGFYFHDGMSPLKKRLFIGVEKIGGMLSDYIFTQSTEDFHTAVEQKIISKKKITAIGNGVDIQKFDLGRVEGQHGAEKIRQEFGIREDEIVVGIIGRVVREKGYMEWIHAAKEVVGEYKNVKFLAVGDTLGSDRDGIKEELESFIEANQLEQHVIFAGSRSDVPEVLSIVDIFTLPSYREGMPRSLIEAMSMSKPAVATNIRGCREEVVEGVTGFLVPVGDAQALAEKILFLVENPQQRSLMGENARKKVEEEFDEKKVIKKQLELIEELIQQKIVNKRRR